MRKIFGFIFVSLLVLAGCTASESGFETLPEGDASRGETLFTENINGSPACSTCHSLDAVRLVGPGLGGYGDNSETRVEGQSSEEYTYNAIVRPGDFLAGDYGNLMYTEYKLKLSEQEIADLIAFLLTL